MSDLIAKKVKPVLPPLVQNNEKSWEWPGDEAIYT